MEHEPRLSPDEHRPAPHLADKPGLPLIHDLVGKDGKTSRERNLERAHLIPCGTLVEVLQFEHGDNAEAGIRLFVVQHYRDCDGSPLYGLGLRATDAEPCSHGWTDENLEAVNA